MEKRRTLKSTAAMSRPMERGSSQLLEVCQIHHLSKVHCSLSSLDGFVRIWSTDAIYNAPDPAYSKPKQLCSMSNHSGTIHSVRFSGTGKYLASGSDDRIVCIYYIDPSPPSEFATFGTLELPHWSAREMAHNSKQEAMKLHLWKTGRSAGD